MTGVLKARVEVYPIGDYEVVPDECAVEDEHRSIPPICYRVHHDGWHRSCPFFVTCTAPSNPCDRQHPSALVLRATTLGAKMVSCQVICHAARRNRPPGC
jgi:hypothetical protein